MMTENKKVKEMKERSLKKEVIVPVSFKENLYGHEFSVEDRNATEKKIADNLIAGIKKSLDSYCYIGYWLVQARHIDFKKSKYYKNWEEFLANTCGFSRKTADNYMLVFKHFAAEDENGNKLPKISESYKSCGFTELVNMARKNNATLPELGAYKDVQIEENKKKAKAEKESDLESLCEESDSEAESEEMVEMEEKGNAAVSYEYLRLPLQITAKGLSLSAPARKKYKPLEKDFGKIDFGSDDWCKKMQDEGYTLELAIRKTENVTVEGAPGDQNDVQVELADFMNAPVDPEEKAM